jgi:beta-glucanase (GH16 family)
LETVDEMEHQAYFPFAGTYDIELIVTKSSQDFSEKQSVTITQDDPNYTGLIWSDEFDYTGLPSPSNWNMETGGGGWGNNELQYYTNTESNAKVENGILTITARKETVGENQYTSARITTQNKFDFKYGRIEARIKLPYGQGLWPAFWMLGANFGSVGWPACGEIDIMEMVGGAGRENTVHSTLHWHDGSHANYGLSYTLSSGIFADNFHIFSVTWDNKEIKGYVDDTEYFVVDITSAAMSEFQNNFFIILNVAVGGDWPGSPDGSTTFPQTMEVDYVRVYEE